MKHHHIFDHSVYYSTLKNQIGGGIHVFAGTRQKDGGLGEIFGAISRYAIPLVKKYIMPHAKQFAIRTASDLLSSGSSTTKTVKSNAKTLVKNVGKDILTSLVQGGKGKGSKRKNIKRSNSVNKKPKTTSAKSQNKSKAKKSKLSKLDFLS